MTGFAAKIGADIGTKVLAIVGGAGCLVLGAALAFTVISKNGEIRSLEKTINDPKTGLVVRLQAAVRDLNTCHSNTITLEDAANQQSAAVAEANAKSQRRIDALTGQLSTSRQATASAERRAATILAARPSEDVCASADQLILENSQ